MKSKHLDFFKLANTINLMSKGKKSENRAHSKGKIVTEDLP